ncbi:hypothetical protein SAMN05216464_111138 [Mucilaginibacter pineti]|uniref:Uncharacterized protein n=1 Tax=Mucilaginibacter pineti TaxID=1391627 RepID=A0A1G7HAG1_9SPHI|nr:hypothetical protein [Mucilaginibacter pineti]SDE97375.1 hypothetical protein SAMN05216464_111138 [Mucilaginibacter pineti]
MHFEKTHLLHFQYHRTAYSLSVDQLCLPGGNAIFKIEMPAVRYWLIRRQDEWKFMADAPTDAAIRRLLIRKIRILSTTAYDA